MLLLLLQLLWNDFDKTKHWTMAIAALGHRFNYTSQFPFSEDFPLGFRD